MDAMTILTIESICQNKHLMMRKSLALKTNYIAPHVVEGIRSLTPSAIITTVGHFARVVRTTRDRNTIFVFPFSLLMLRKTDMYDIVLKLLSALGVTPNHRQISVCIDGNVNIALEEMFDAESCTMTLEELQHWRLIITGKIRDECLILSNDVDTVRIVNV